jgi:hypothetical protein
MLYNENIKGEYLGQENKLLVKILHTILAEGEFS